METPGYSNISKIRGRGAYGNRFFVRRGGFYGCVHVRTSPEAFQTRRVSRGRRAALPVQCDSVCGNNTFRVRINLH